MKGKMSVLLNADIHRIYEKGGENMPKDSQPDTKRARKIKSKGQTSIAADAQSNSRTTKKQSADRSNV